MGKEREALLITEYRERAERPADLGFVENNSTAASCSRIEEERKF